MNRVGQGAAHNARVCARTAGAGGYFAPRGQGKAFCTHAGNASVSHEWETPGKRLEALHAGFGRFALDSCAPRRWPPSTWHWPERGWQGDRTPSGAFPSAFGDARRIRGAILNRSGRVRECVGVETIL